jgi:hypothetical protein
MLALGVTLAIVAALGMTSLYLQAGDRVPVLALAADVPVGQKITDADLTQANIAVDAALDPVPASRRAEIVGKTAAVDLRRGGLLTESSVSDRPVLTEGKQVVGIATKPGQMPGQRPVPGDRVLIVATPGQDGEIPSRTPSSIDAVVVNVGPPDANDVTVVDVAVPGTDGPALAARAATGKVAIVLQPRTGG